MTHPIVGVTTSRRGGTIMWWCSWLALKIAGLNPIRMTAPLDKQKLDKIDGLLVGGGDDIGASLYQDGPNLDIRIDPKRDALEQEVLADALKKDMPVLGICRGAQMLNIHLGGNLHQDIYETFENVPKMRTPLPRKQVHVSKDSHLFNILGREKFCANSIHHQSIDRLGKGLEICAKDDYGIVQAIEDPNANFRMGVQWHPEFLIYHSWQRSLFNAFADAIKKIKSPT